MSSLGTKIGFGGALIGAILMASSIAAKTQPQSSAPDYFKDSFSVERVLDWGSRPIWSPDSKRIVFTRDDKAPSPAYELDLRTRKVKCLTCRFGDAGLVLRIYYLPDDSFLILAPPGLDATGRKPAASTESASSGSELYWMPANASRAPQSLGAPAFGEIAIDYASGGKDASRIAWGEFAPNMRMTVGEITHNGKRASLSNRKVAYTYPPADPQSVVTFTETYDFLNDEDAILFFTAERGRPVNGMYKISLANGELTPMPRDGQHIETHVFPDTRYGLEESNRASDPASPMRGMSAHPKEIARMLATYSGVPYANKLAEKYAGRTFDLYVVDLQSGERRRLTHVSDLGGQAHQSSTARDGQHIIFKMMAPNSGPFAGKSGLYLGAFSAVK